MRSLTKVWQFPPAVKENQKVTFVLSDLPFPQSCDNDFHKYLLDIKSLKNRKGFHILANQDFYSSKKKLGAYQNARQFQEARTWPRDLLREVNTLKSETQFFTKI